MSALQVLRLLLCVLFWTLAEVWLLLDPLLLELQVLPFPD